ncbi:NAD(P)H nitroreductase [Mycobacterium sp. CVI_P3]|uniref:NAD(P)H nitroreductase n=1 Tax=Mycobacterium pinniadriaticum TaxID=2994102 RepID=A0ABT3SE09_9MYCO|nr:NAD(P)H nitroreductase [Mycobacterium pinniadriaticum]MCX2931315.1 NAD(P)H nitroreductase [Mycobacterium pinniadriaticum]MCX2937739.1 NAD(P)H nitroreductase [Mycobacterium pinniadriaticum]
MAKSALDPQVIANAVQLACRAPSVHNSQPWHWVAEGSDLKLFLAPHRVPHATDISGRESIISCGAVLDHLRVALAAAGWRANIARFPNPNDPDHLATIDFSPSEFVTDAERARADAILTRRTDRLPFAPPPDWAAFEPVLRSTINTDQAVLHVLPATIRPQLAEASRLTESLRRYDSSYHAELHWWTAPYEMSDGVPYSNLVSAAERDRLDIARTFPADEHPDRRPEVDHDQSTIVVLSTYNDTRRDALGCGEVLSDVLLEATVAGLATCTLTHMTELEASRSIIRALTGDRDNPQLLIRIGLAPAIAQLPPATPRRPPADVLEFRG